MPLVRESNLHALFAANVIAGGICCSAALFFGAVHPPVMALAFLGASVAAALSIWARKKSGRRIYLHFLGLPIAAGVLLTAFSLVPLPQAVALFFDEAAFNTVAFMTEGLPLDAQALVRNVWHAEAPEGGFALLRLCTALLLFGVIADGSQERKIRKLHIKLALFFGLVIMAVAVAHPLFYATKVYGLLAPSPRTPVFGPLLNPNHLSRVLGFFSLLGVTGFIQLRSRDDRIRMGVMGLFCGIGVPLTLSRGGTLAYLIVMVLTMLVKWLEWKRSDKEGNSGEEISRLKMLLIFGFFGLILVGFFGAKEWMLELELTLKNPQSKGELWQLSAELLQAHPWGVGNGAFPSMVPSVLESPQQIGHATLTHPENIFLSTLVSYGVLAGGTLILLGVGIGIFLVRETWKNGLMLALPPLAFLVFADFFGFAIDLGVGLFLVAWSLGMLSGHQVSGQRAEQRHIWKVKPVKATAGVLLLFLLGLFVLPMSLFETRYTLMKDLQAQKNATTQELRAAFAKGLALHPHEGWFALGLALQEKRERDVEKSVFWLRRTLVAHPGMHDAHLEFARLLLKIGKKDQAMLEYRLALRYPSNTYKEILSVSRDVDELLKVFEEYPFLKRRACSHLAQLKDIDLDEVQRCFDRIVKSNPALKPAMLQAVVIAIRRGDFIGAKRRLANPGIPHDDRWALLSVQILAKLQGEDAAYVQAKIWIEDSSILNFSLHKWCFHFENRKGRYQDAAVRLESLSKLAAPPQQYGIEKLRVGLFLRQNEWAEALRTLEKMKWRWPKKQWVFLTLASTQHRLKLHLLVQDSLQKAAELGESAALTAMRKRLLPEPSSPKPSSPKPSSPPAPDSPGAEGAP
ncbi:MAG: hypothetical protein GY822_04880 [Deltaproteobacteria bacterium]|nr:hypothetical protein [Deltaproteobacteria bacterium]